MWLAGVAQGIFFIIPIMEDEDEVILGGPACSSQEAFGGDGVDPVLLEVESAEGSQRGHIRGPRDVPRRGSFGAWLLVDAHMKPAATAVDGVVPEVFEGVRVVGLFLATWMYVANTDEAKQIHTGATHTARRGRSFNNRCWGFLQYAVDRVWTFADVPLPPTLDVYSGCVGLKLRKLTGRAKLAGIGAGVCVDDFLLTSEESFFPVGCIAWYLGPLVVRTLAAGCYFVTIGEIRPVARPRAGPSADSRH